MKIFIVSLCMLLCANVALSQEAFTYVSPIVEVQTLPAYSFSTYAVPVYKPMVYQWVPQIINEPIVVQKFGLFGHRTQIVYKPTIRWVYQLAYLP